MLLGVKHKQPKITKDEAGSIIEGMGQTQKAFEVISDAFLAGFGSDEETLKKDEGTPAAPSQ